MPCSKLEVSTVQNGTLSGTGYLHQSQFDLVRNQPGHEIGLRPWIPKQQPEFFDVPMNLTT